MKISVIFPVKDQTDKLVANLRTKAIPFYDSLGVDYEFLIVDDGSDLANQSAMILAMQTMPKRVRLVPYESQKGKGHNVKRGIEAATGDYVMFMDADLSTDLNAVKKIIPIIGTADCFIGSRHCKGAMILSRQTALRRIISWCSRKLIKAEFRFKGISDTQCGYKLFRNGVAKMLAAKQKDDGFAFDVEYLYILSLNGYAIKEIPVRWSDDPDSTISHPFRTSVGFWKEMRKIKRAKASYVLTAEEKASI
jgi:dolichyl-phosphate beta-glucosyltransferase